MMVLKKWKQFLRHKTDEFFIDRQNMNDAVHQESGSRQVSVTFPHLTILHERESKLNCVFFF